MARAPAVLADSTITSGDEFQGPLVRPVALPELQWRLRDRLPALRFRSGAGFGAAHTGLRERALGIDGPAFHRTRQTLGEDHDRRLHGGVFSGIGGDDRILGGLARRATAEEWSR